MIMILYQGGGGDEDKKIDEKADEEEGRGRPGNQITFEKIQVSKKFLIYKALVTK